MPNQYRTRAAIDWNGPVTIQMATTGLQFTNAVQPDTLLVLENGIWKFPRSSVDAVGAIPLPLSSGTGRKIGAVRLVSFQAAWGGSANWNMNIVGNTSNTTGTPYPSGSAALYDEGTLQVANGSGAFNMSATYGFGTTGTGVPILLPGQTLYIASTAAANPLIRLTFMPLFNSPGGL